MTRGPLVCPLAALAVGALLTVPVPSRSREVHALMDLAHAPTFGVLALVVLAAVRGRFPRSPRRDGPAVWVAVTLFGGAMELAQALSGRHPSWHDALANALGAAAFLVFAAYRSAPTPGRRLALAAAGSALLALPSAPPLLTLADAGLQARDFPLLASFENPTELSRWDFGDCRAARTRDHATDGDWALRLGLGPGLYPSATLTWPARDWSGRAALTFDADLSPGPPLDLVVKIEGLPAGRRAAARFERVVRLRPGPQRVRIDLSDAADAPAGRRLDLRRVGRLQFFAVALRSTRVLFLDEVRLR